MRGPDAVSPTAVVTGAAGFLGSAFAATLRQRGWEVRGIDTRPAPGVTVGDITESGQWTEQLLGAQLVVHAAAITAESGDRTAFRQVNVEGTRQVLAEAAAADVGRVLHLSSIVVHGSDFPDGVDEDGAVSPTGNPYTDSKIGAEHQALLAAAAGRVPVTVVRPGDIYGPGSQPWTVRPVELMRRGLFVLFDGGRGVLSPVYVDDVVEGALLAAERDEAVGEVFHVTGGQAVTAGHFFSFYAEALGVRLRSVPAGAARALIGPSELASHLGWQPPVSPRAVEYLTREGTYSVAKAARRLGWSPRVPLESGMAATLEWLAEAGLVPGGGS